MNILIIDDFEDLETVYRHILDEKVKKYNLDFISKLDKLNTIKGEYDLAFVDWFLGKNDEYVDIFASDIIDLVNAPHICIITGYPKDTNANKFAKKNGFPLIPKPIWPHAVEMAISKAKALKDKKKAALLNSK